MKSIFYLCFFIFLCAQSSDDENPIFEKIDQNLEAFMNLTTNQILTIRKNNKYKTRNRIEYKKKKHSVKKLKLNKMNLYI